MRSSQMLSRSAGRAFFALASLPILASASVLRRDNATNIIYTPSASTIVGTSSSLYTPVDTYLTQTTPSSYAVESTTSQTWLPNAGTTDNTINTPNSIDTTTSVTWLPSAYTTDSTISTPGAIDTTTSTQNWLPSGDTSVYTTSTPALIDTTSSQSSLLSDSATSEISSTYSTPSFYTTTTTDAITSTTSTGQTGATTTLPAETTNTGNTITSTQPASSDAGITVAPATSTVTGAEATSSVSSVSSEIVALVGVINSWKDDTSGLKTDTLNQVENVKSEVESVISELGGTTSSGCNSKRKRSILSFITDAINTLTCVAEDLTKVAEDITSDDVDAVTGLVSTISSSADDLNDDDDDNKTESDSESSATSTTSTETETSTCTEATALHVTILCEPTTYTSDDSVISTTTCFSSTTVTTAGCSATDYTSIISTSTSTESQVPCASDTCEDSCPMNAGVLSGASMSVVATEDCASLSTITTSELPTASYGVLYSAAVATPTEEASLAASKRETTHSYRYLVERALEDVASPNANYVSQLDAAWVSQDGLATGQFYDFPSYGHAYAGVNGIYGCTAVMIVSEKGVYISHIWENPVFIDNDWKATSDDDFKKNSFEALRDGSSAAQSISTLVGTDDNPGVLNTVYSPKVFVISPFTSEWDKTQGITTKLRYQDRAQSLASNIAGIVPGSGDPFVLGYTRTSAAASTAENSAAGRAIVEIDPFQSWLVSDKEDVPSDSAGLQIGRWRMWVEDQMVTYQDFWVPRTAESKRKRDSEVSAACSLSAASETSTATSTSATSESTGTVTSATGYCTSYADADSSTSYCTCSSTAGTSVLYTSVSMTSGGCSYSKYPTLTMTTVTSTANSNTTTGAAETTTLVTTTDEPTTTDGSTTTEGTTTAGDSTTLTTTTEESTTTAAATITGDPICVNYGGPMVTSNYCECSTTTAGQTFYATAPHISNRCEGYTTFPSTVTLAPSTTAVETTAAAATSTAPAKVECDKPSDCETNGWTGSCTGDSNAVLCIAGDWHLVNGVSTSGASYCGCRSDL